MASDAHLDAIAAAHQNAAATVRQMLAPLPESVLPLESKLAASVAMAEVAAAIGIARGTAPAEGVFHPMVRRRCEATKDDARCVRPVALDKVSICAGPHDFGPLPDNVVPLRPTISE